MAVFEGKGKAEGGRYLVAAARFNEWITRRLLEGALKTLREAGCPEDGVDVAWVPGSFELPLAARTAAATGRYRAVVCVGAVIRGETTHHVHIAAECARGIQEAAVATGIPVTFGVITADSVALAEERSRTDGGRNIGAEAARAAVEAVRVLDSIRKGG